MAARMREPPAARGAAGRIPATRSDQRRSVGASWRRDLDRDCCRDILSDLRRDFRRDLRRDSCHDFRRGGAGAPRRGGGGYPRSPTSNRRCGLRRRPGPTAGAISDTFFQHVPGGCIWAATPDLTRQRGRRGRASGAPRPPPGAGPVRAAAGARARRNIECRAEVR